jgi:hypothetical protein
MGRYNAAGLRTTAVNWVSAGVAAFGRCFVFPEIKCYSRKIAGPVAQLDRAPAYEAGGWEFDPPRGRFPFQRVSCPLFSGNQFTVVEIVETFCCLSIISATSCAL